MKLDRHFFLKVYGYEISFPGFTDVAIRALEDAGCSKAREYYDKTVAEYQRKQDEEMKHVAAWYRMECERGCKKNQKGGEERRKKMEINSLQQMSNKDLIALLESLTGAI